MLRNAYFSKFIRLDFMATELNKIFSCNKPCRFLTKAQHFGDHLCLHYKGTRLVAREDSIVFLTCYLTSLRNESDVIRSPGCATTCNFWTNLPCIYEIAMEVILLTGSQPSGGRKPSVTSYRFRITKPLLNYLRKIHNYW